MDTECLHHVHTYATIERLIKILKALRFTRCLFLPICVLFHRMHASGLLMFDQFIFYNHHCWFVHRWDWCTRFSPCPSSRFWSLWWVFSLLIFSSKFLHYFLELPRLSILDFSDCSRRLLMSGIDRRLIGDIKGKFFCNFFVNWIGICWRSSKGRTETFKYIKEDFKISLLRPLSAPGSY